MEGHHYSEHNHIPGPFDNGWEGFVQWVDKRTGLDHVMRFALNEPIPGGAKLAYVFGSGLLFLFLSQVITGVFLAMYYVPSADHAHTTVAYITKEVTGGSLIRSIHAYGSALMVIVLLLHVLQTFFFGAYKGHRELLWVAGCVLFALMMGMSFTGYLLPWDQKAFFATTVGTNIASEVPLIGNFIKRLMRGGSEMGTLTLSRFYVFHVFMIPGLIFTALAAHVYLFRKAGPAGPYYENPVKPKLPTEPFYPKQVLMDLGFALVLIIGLGLLASIHPMDLGPKADPSETQYLPRPEWYYLPAFQWLKYWQGATAIIGILIIPTVLAALFVGLPFYDKKIQRHPLRRPLAVGIFSAVLCGIFYLGFQSYYGDTHDAAIARQLKRQQDDTESFMKAKFEPEMSGAALMTANAALANPEAVKGRAFFESEGCSSCHGEHGEGSPVAPKLTIVHAKYDRGQLTELLHAPNKAMREGGMEPLKLKDEDFKLLIEYLEGLK